MSMVCDGSWIQCSLQDSECAKGLRNDLRRLFDQALCVLGRGAFALKEYWVSVEPHDGIRSSGHDGSSARSLVEPAPKARLKTAISLDLSGEWTVEQEKQSSRG